MKKTFSLISIILAASFACISCGQPAATNNAAAKPVNAANNATATAPAANAAAIEADIKKAIDNMGTALKNNDSAAMEKMFTDTYRFVSTDGSVSTGPERIASMKTGDTKFDSITYDEVSVRSNPEGTGAVSIARVTVKGKNLGTPVEGQNRVTYVWSKAADGWRLASAQVTEIRAAPDKRAANTANANSNTANE
jgi:ketosteroid isomerase-like protein